MGRKRVVVTGIGAITPLGSTFEDTWKRLLQPSSRFSRNESLVVTTLEEALIRQKLPESILEAEYKLTQQLPCQIAAPALYDRMYNPRTGRFIQLALDATLDALTNSGLIDYYGVETTNNKERTAEDDKISVTDCTNVNDDASEIVYQKRRDRCGVGIGSAMSSVREIFHTSQLMINNSYRKISPYFVPNCLPNSASARVALQYKFRGPNQCASTACAAGGHAIGDAYRTILLSHNIDVMICGGTESCIDPISMAGFCRLHALATSYNDYPNEASRPFDIDRNGFVMAEGAAILVLEELEHALERNAPIIFAEVTGYSLTGDAYHITSPDPSYHSSQTCIRNALDEHHRNNLQINPTDSYHNNANNENLPQQVGYVNAHATSTPKGDEIEARCIYETLSDYYNSSRSRNIYVSSTKGSTGHLLGAAGALEAAFTANALHKQVIPYTNNLKSIDPNCSLHNDDMFANSYGEKSAVNRNDNINIHHVVNEPIHLNKEIGLQPLEVAMSNSFGFGGTNSCLIFQRYVPPSS